MTDVQMCMFTSDLEQVTVGWSWITINNLANWLHVLAQLCSFISWIRIVNVASICEIAGGKKEVKLGRQ